MDKKTLCAASKKTYFRMKDTYRQIVKGWKKIFHRKEKKAEEAMLISNKIEFKTKSTK